MTFKLWTAEQDELLRKLWAEGLSGRLIGFQMGVTKNSVIGRVHRLKLAARTPGWPVGTTVPSAVRLDYLARRERPQGTGGGIGANISRGVGKAFARLSPPKVAAPKPVAEPTCRPVKLMNLKPRSCRWPVKEETGAKQLFCGATHEIGVPYCAFHAKLSLGHSAPEWTPERRAKFNKSMGIGGLAAP